MTVTTTGRPQRKRRTARVPARWEHLLRGDVVMLDPTGRRLRTAIVLSGMSLRALARRSGVDPGLISNLQNGKRHGVTPQTAAALERFLGKGLFGMRPLQDKETP